MSHRKSLVSFMIFGVFSACLLTSTVLAQQGKLIEQIDIQGNRRLADQEISKVIKTRAGQTYDEKQAQDDVTSLLKMGQFDPTAVRVVTEPGLRGGVNVIFEVRELPLLVELKFEGLRYASKEELLAELRERNAELTVNSPYNPNKLRKARRVLTNYLVTTRGFVDAKVTISEEEVTATTLTISFVIDEMPNDDDESPAIAPNAIVASLPYESMYPSFSLRSSSRVRPSAMSYQR